MTGAWRGWSINLTIEGQEHTFETTLPAPPLFMSSLGPVVELVFWSDTVSRWMHAVSAPFWRELPEGHVQVTVGDLVWLKGVMDRRGGMGLAACVRELEASMVPGVDA